MSEEQSRNLNPPFVARATPAMDRAQRLLSLRTHPGFLDLIRMSQDMAERAAVAERSYPGWDKDVIVALHCHTKAAYEHHEAWLAAIQTAIEQGESEARELQEQNNLPEKSDQETIEESDMLRINLLRKFEDFETRAGGSY
jgi:predicted metallo-beta-lactamase superfamily hydrolase